MELTNPPFPSLKPRNCDFVEQHCVEEHWPMVGEEGFHRKVNSGSTYISIFKSLFAIHKITEMLLKSDGFQDAISLVLKICDIIMMKTQVISVHLYYTWVRIIIIYFL